MTKDMFISIIEDVLCCGLLPEDAHLEGKDWDPETCYLVVGQHMIWLEKALQAYTKGDIRE